MEGPANLSVSEPNMPPIAKDPEAAIAGPGVSNVPGAPAAKTSGEPTGKPQPVALEIPVTVNGARSVAGSDKREPFSETTKTVLIFGHGAVIRLAAMVAPGQLLFLTNEKSKKEVVCQVVKSKNYKTVTGYVELEFTEASSGFWGMRFPSTASAPRPVAPAAVAPPPAPLAQKVQAPPVTVAPKNVVSTSLPPVVAIEEAAKPDLAALLAKHIAPPAVSAAPTPRVVPAPVAPVIAMEKKKLPEPVVEAKIEESPAAAPKIAPGVEASAPTPITLESALLSTPAAPEAKVEKPKDTLEAAPVSPSSEELKQQSARLQEQLGSMFFADNSGAQSSQPAAEKEATPRSNAEKKLLDLFEEKIDLQAPPANISGPATKPLATSLDAEEVKIPSWLAPLSREAEKSTMPSVPEVEAGEITEASGLSTESSAGVFVPLADEIGEKAQPAMFGGQLLGDANAAAGEASRSGSKKGLFFGIAAALLLLAGGGYWYMQQGSASHAASAATTPATASLPVEAAKTPAQSPAPITEPATLSNKANPAAIPAATGASSNVPPAQNARTASPFTPAPPAVKNSTPAPIETAASQEVKKPVLGQVRLANPVVGRTKRGADNEELAPAIDVNQPVAGGDALGGLVAARGKQPAAPIPVGGEVKQAQLIKSVPPLYPSMAKSQRISGDVKMDALIDASGNVTSTKVLSGPTLLQQAATDAVQQWKYRPAELDGKATSMHLTVMVQFRLQ